MYISTEREETMELLVQKSSCYKMFVSIQRNNKAEYNYSNE